MGIGTLRFFNQRFRVGTQTPYSTAICCRVLTRGEETGILIRFLGCAGRKLGKTTPGRQRYTISWNEFLPESVYLLLHSKTVDSAEKIAHQNLIQGTWKRFRCGRFPVWVGTLHLPGSFLSVIFKYKQYSSKKQGFSKEIQTGHSWMEPEFYLEGAERCT